MADGARPLLIGHRAGNHLDRMAAAFAAGADYVEADVWLHHGKLEVRHEKSLWPLPLLYDGWKLFPGWRRRLALRDVLLAARGRGRLFIDLKGREPGLPAAMVGVIAAAGAEETVAFSSPGWHFLDELAEALPQAPLFYTISDPERMELLRPRLAKGEITAVSIHSRMLSAAVIDELKSCGVRLMTTWAVETEADARRVLGYGATGITTKNLALLAAIRNGELN